MSKLQRKTQYARERGIYVFRLPDHIDRIRRDMEASRSPYAQVKLILPKVKIDNSRVWAVYIEGEWYPRINLTHREAVNLAYAVSIAKKVEFEVTCYTSYEHKGTTNG